jgi:hypothetical protein
VIRITITPAAYAAIAATLALGTVAVEPERARDGSVHVWLDPGVLAKLKALRGPARATATSSCGWLLTRVNLCRFDGLRFLRAGRLDRR